jgi:hypothetical protein
MQAGTAPNNAAQSASHPYGLCNMAADAWKANTGQAKESNEIKFLGYQSHW